MLHDLRRPLSAARSRSTPAVLFGLLLLTGCASWEVTPNAATAAGTPTAVSDPTAATTGNGTGTEAKLPAVGHPGTTSPPPTDWRSATDLLTWSLGYAEHVRQLSPPEVAAEVASAGEPGGDVRRLMQLALALMHSPQAADTARALGLLQRVIQHPSPEAISVQPLARLLATRLQAQRRLEDVQDRLNQQLRESQRRNELLSDQLDAMRAIERSLSPRLPAPVNR